MAWRGWPMSWAWTMSGSAATCSGLVGPGVFDSYRQLPDLAAAMLAVGFSAGDVGKVLGGNYARVFAATMT